MTRNAPYDRTSMGIFRSPSTSTREAASPRSWAGGHAKGHARRIPEAVERLQTTARAWVASLAMCGCDGWRQQSS